MAYLQKKIKYGLFLITGIFVGAGISLYAAVGYFGGGMYVDDQTNNWGIGSTSPSSLWKFSVIGNTFLSDLWVGNLKGCAVGSLVETDAGGKVICGTDDGALRATSTATSVSDSNNKTLTAWCPATYRATGGGGEITAGNAAGLVVNQSFPTATTSGWTTIFQEAVSVTGLWTARAHVVCVK